MPEPAFEPMPQNDNQPPPPDAGTLLFNRLISLQGELSEIEKELKNTTDEKIIKELIAKKLEKEKRITNYKESVRNLEKKEKYKSLKKDVGEEIFSNVYDIETGKRKIIENDPKLGPNFMNELDKFKREKKAGAKYH